MGARKASIPKDAPKEPNLRGKNTLYLWAFLGVNIAVFFSLVVSRHFDATSISHSWAGVSAKNGIVAASLPIVGIILGGLLSDTAKARLVFWRWKHPLPGTRVFSELISSDSRINVTALKVMIGKFPRAPQDQNALWYQIYRKHKLATSVWQSHKTYLLTRDLSTIAALCIPLLTLGVGLIGAGWVTVLTYFILLTAQFALIATAARNYGNRFALNVLCEQSCAQPSAGFSAQSRGQDMRSS